MNEKVENLLLEHMRAMRADIARMGDSMRLFGAELTAIRQHLAGVTTIQDHDHGDIAALKARIDRIETRLDLVD